MNTQYHDQKIVKCVEDHPLIMVSLPTIYVALTRRCDRLRALTRTFSKLRMIIFIPFPLSLEGKISRSILLDQGWPFIRALFKVSCSFHICKYLQNWLRDIETKTQLAHSRLAIGLLQTYRCPYSPSSTSAWTPSNPAFPRISANPFANPQCMLYR